jgi:hypothetical protein
MSDAVERLSRDGADTTLHLINETDVWLDTENGETDGLVIGTGEDRAAAIHAAIRELTERVLDLVDALHGKPEPPEAA